MIYYSLNSHVQAIHFDLGRKSSWPHWVGMWRSNLHWLPKVQPACIIYMELSGAQVNFCLSAKSWLQIAPPPPAQVHFQGQRFSNKTKSLIIICTSYRYRSRTQEEVRSKNWVESDMRHLTFIYGKKKSKHSTHLSQSEHGAAAAKSFFIPLDKLLDCCVRDLHVRCHNGSFFVWTWWDCNKVKLHILQLCHL